MQETVTKNLEELMKYKDLIDTIIEGLNYVNSKLKIGEFDKSIEIFTEMITGINVVISGIGNKMNTNSQVIVDGHLALLVSAYEQRDTDKIVLIISTKLIPFIKEIQNDCL